MDAPAAHLLHHLGRPGAIRLGTALTGPPAPLPTRLAPLDALLNGGLPRGRITELIGPRSAGRTGLAVAIAAGTTQGNELVAWIDPDDALDLDSAATTGLVLAHTLWVRPSDPHDVFRAADLLLGAGGFALVVLDLARPELGRGFTRWTRLARTAERSGTVLLIVSSTRRLGPHSTLGLEMAARRTCWSSGPGRLTSLDGVTSRLTVSRSRFGRSGDTLILQQARA